MANVLITGCSSGFGLLTALRFARGGDRVVATMRSPGRAPVELTGPIAAESLPITVTRLDVCEPASVADAVRAAGPIDVLINNAGIELRSPVEEASDEDVRRQFETNVLGTLRVIRAVLPGMRERGSGTIVNLSSIAGLAARPFGGLYSASKHAVEAITEALHFEVRPFGVRVVLIEPGQFGTRLLDNAFAGAGFGAHSPYRSASDAFDVKVRRLLPDAQEPDPAEVAEIIHAAVHDQRPRLRYLAGADAQLVADAHRTLDFEQYEQAMRGALDWFD